MHDYIHLWVLQPETPGRVKAAVFVLVMTMAVLIILGKRYVPGGFSWRLPLAIFLSVCLAGLLTAVPEVGSNGKSLVDGFVALLAKTPQVGEVASRRFFTTVVIGLALWALYEFYAKQTIGRLAWLTLALYYVFSTEAMRWLVSKAVSGVVRVWNAVPG